jgi:hypothetical protein
LGELEAEELQREPKEPEEKPKKIEEQEEQICETPTISKKSTRLEIKLNQK